MADNNFPGGSVELGSGAQEESIFRRTNYHKTLTIDMYPLKNDEAIYSTDVSVLKSDESTNWLLLKDPSKISLIACPGVREPYCQVVKGEKRLNDNDTQILKNKIRTIIQTAVKYNHDSIIFGALGCGAWRNPIKHVAEIFKEVLEEYDGVILNYYFAIMTCTSGSYIVKNYDISDMTTIEIFKSVFN